MHAVHNFLNNIALARGDTLMVKHPHNGEFCLDVGELRDLADDVVRFKLALEEIARDDADTCADIALRALGPKFPDAADNTEAARTAL